MISSKECRKICVKENNECWRADTNTCEPCCHQSCRTCPEGLKNEDDCLSCRNPGQYVQIQDQVLKKGVCKDCYFSCSTCSGPKYNECTSCVENLFLSSGHCGPCAGFLELSGRAVVCKDCSLPENKDKEDCQKVKYLTLTPQIKNSKQDIL